MLLNLFAPNQEIAYHLAGDTTLYQISHRKFRSGNGDTVTFHGMDSASAWEAVQGADVVILAEEAPVERIQALRIACENGVVYYYAPHGTGAGAYLKFSRLHPFGEGLYTDENIRGEALVLRAKEQNYDYAKEYGHLAPGETADGAWRKLDGFTQWSNISSADFQEILPDILAARPALTLEQLAALEHLRWCRFHTLNGWQYGIPQSGSRDMEKKLHRFLCPYEALGPKEQEKTQAMIRRALSNMDS